MKKTIFVVALSIAGFIAVWRFEPTPLGSTAVAQPQPQTSITTTPSTPDPSTSSGESGSGATTTSPAPSTSDTPSPSTVVVTQGTEESSEFGTVQVQVTFSGSKITDIKLLQQPRSGRAVTALPQLQQEALQAQSANIDTISGATQTSDSYKTSLQAAIDRRGA